MNSTVPDRVNVLIASPLEVELAERIESAEPQRARVVYEPNILPVPRYIADHDGERRTHSTATLARWRAHLASADILFDFDWFEPHRIPVNAPRVRWIQATSAGVVDHLSRAGLLDSNIIVTTAAGVHVVPLAEHVALGLLYLVKDVPKLRRWQAAHHWEDCTTGQLAGRRMLLVGLGQVGRKIALTCADLGLEIWGVDPATVDPPRGVSRIVSRAGLRPALREVDAVVLACPLTPETYHLIGDDEFAQMRPSTIMVNVARGSVVDEPALIKALTEQRLAGAVLDVFEDEPLPDDSPLWDMPNVLVSPHSASRVPGENALITELFIDNLRRYLAGQPLRNVYSRARGF